MSTKLGDMEFPFVVEVNEEGSFDWKTFTIRLPESAAAPETQCLAELQERAQEFARNFVDPSPTKKGEHK